MSSSASTGTTRGGPRGRTGAGRLVSVGPAISTASSSSVVASAWARIATATSSTGTRGRRNSGIDVGASAGQRWLGRHQPSGENDGNVDDSAVNHAIVHVRDGHLGILLLLVQDVGRSAIRVNLLARLSQIHGVEEGCALLTNSIHWQIEVEDGAILAEYLAEMGFPDVLGQALDHDLRGEPVSHGAPRCLMVNRGRTLVPTMTRGSLGSRLSAPRPRLKLRLSLL